jgi:hypothetical protein
VPLHCGNGCDSLLANGEDETIEKMARGQAVEGSKAAKALSEIQKASYAQLTEGGKLKNFLGLLSTTIGEKPMKLIEHLQLIFGSQKHQSKKKH